jgi:hypothetical protein
VPDFSATHREQKEKASGAWYLFQRLLRTFRLTG